MIDFLKSIFDSIGNFFIYIRNVITDFFTYIDEMIKAIEWFFTNLFTSLKLFIIDLPVLIIKWLFDFLGFLLSLFPSICGYCFEGLVPHLNASFSSLFSFGEMGGAFCYILEEIGFGSALQTLSCGVSMWAILRLVSFIRG